MKVCQKNILIQAGFCFTGDENRSTNRVSKKKSKEK